MKHLLFATLFALTSAAFGQNIPVKKNKITPGKSPEQFVKWDKKEGKKPQDFQSILQKKNASKTYNLTVSFVYY